MKYIMMAIVAIGVMAVSKAHAEIEVVLLGGASLPGGDVSQAFGLKVMLLMLLLMGYIIMRKENEN